ncbi:hypothetical protein KC356_g2139 [Hortaea werneckii]|nr:hypothetical protein KC356_g2139 [Hortaea werneckii]
MTTVKSEMAKTKSDSLMELDTPGETANINTKDRQASTTAAGKTNSTLRWPMSSLTATWSPRNLLTWRTSTDRQEFATAAKMANIKSEMAGIKSEIAEIKSAMANIKSDGRMEPKTPTGVTNFNADDRQKSATAAEVANVRSEMVGVKFGNHPEPGTTAGTANVKSEEFERRQELDIPASMAMSRSSNDAAQSSKGRRTPEVIVLSSDPTESPASALSGTVNTKSDDSERHHLENFASETQSTNAAVRSGTTVPIPAVIALSSDPTGSPTSAPHGTEERTIQVIELSSDPPEGASSTPSTSHSSKRLRANSPDSASKRPHGSPAADAKLQKKA